MKYQNLPPIMVGIAISCSIIAVAFLAKADPPVGAPDETGEFNDRTCVDYGNCDFQSQCDISSTGSCINCTETELLDKYCVEQGMPTTCHQGIWYGHCGDRWQGYCQNGTCISSYQEGECFRLWCTMP